VSFYYCLNVLRVKINVRASERSKLKHDVGVLKLASSLARCLPGIEGRIVKKVSPINERQPDAARCAPDDHRTLAGFAYLTAFQPCEGAAVRVRQEKRAAPLVRYRTTIEGQGAASEAANLRGR